MENEQEAANDRISEASSSKKKRWKKYLFIPFFTFIICSIIYGYNFFSLQYPMNKILLIEENKGIDVSVGFENYINFSTVVYDLRSCQHKTKKDVYRVLFQFAEKKKDSNFDYIILSCRGINKFKIPGEFFKKIGIEYSKEKMVPLIKAFPRNIQHLDGSPLAEIKTDSLLISEEDQIKDCCKFMFEWLKK